MSDQIVETIELDLMPASSVTALEDFRNVRALWDIEIIIQGVTPAGYRVKYRGYESVLRLFLKEQYGVNEKPGSVEMKYYIDSLLGDTLAEHRWNTGCTIGLDGTSFVKINDERFMWSHHWHEARYTTKVVDLDEVGEWATERLVASGYDNPEDSNTDIAQAYLNLAAMYCPRLMENRPLVAKKPFDEDKEPGPEAYVVVDGNAYYFEERDEGVATVMHCPVNADGSISWDEANESEVMPYGEHTRNSVLMDVLFDSLRFHHKNNC